ncbi:MAG: VOC family protein [Ignavibacteria bacterium]|jgi:predicted enzyme related to lactoylglutathione lyase
MAHFITWFEIPVTDFERAKKFYEGIFGVKVVKQEMGGSLMGFFPGERGSVSGAIVSGKGYIPSDNGALVYLNGGNDLNNVLSKVVGAGGKVAMPKTLINEDIGFFAIFHDTEGNKVALHSLK